MVFLRIATKPMGRVFRIAIEPGTFGSVTSVSCAHCSHTTSVSSVTLTSRLNAWSSSSVLHSGGCASSSRLPPPRAFPCTTDLPMALNRSLCVPW